MLTVKQRIIIDIISVAFGGSGIGRFEGQVVFVPFTVDGDKVEAEITKIKNRYCVASLTRVLSPSPYRVIPRCSLFKVCGGCHYQHIEYEHELAVKKRQIVDIYERIGGITSPPVEDVVPSPEEYAYRQKADFHCRKERGKTSVGFMGLGNIDVIDVTRCEIVDESINEEYKNVKHRVISGEVDDMRLRIWSGVPYKSDWRIERKVKDKILTVPYNSFFQANATLADALVDSVEEACNPLSGSTVFDCYCGSGIFSLFLASGARRVIGCDTDSSALRSAEHNLISNNLTSAFFYHGSAEKIMRKLRQKSFPIDTVLLDPPRGGLTAGISRELIALGPTKIIYLSCNPATQARDIQCLEAGGYMLNKVRPFDMFPKTKHVEVLAILKKGFSKNYLDP
ncbi:MAG: class I SAM-dependent RNA methyltransferase [Syntrophales bacterium]|jgi:tRNA/tmRNA/rRNA uracil-C5-methylase (TrmA/RlmC/RlmD family)|nr:class I SAM-dependent RNA methyltransferase [Syntrophales bacterium]MDY0044211.1 class I SAM-dependent RNA methyltransferase [Syntrophales bacterium]